MSAIELACVGAGYWGKSLVRVFRDMPDVNLRQVCDGDPAICAAVERQSPGVATGADYEALLRDDDLDAGVRAGPAARHYDMARRALESGKHVYVEKPMTLATADAEELVELADARERVLMVGHILDYHPAVEALLGLIGDGELGKVQNILLQANFIGESTKSGLSETALEELILAVGDCSNDALLGFMTMAPFGVTAATLAEVFGGLRDFRYRRAAPDDLPLSELSMGMSGDYQHAISHGATLVRVGTAIFGLRPR